MPVLVLFLNRHRSVDVPIVFGVGVDERAVDELVVGLTLVSLEFGLGSARCFVCALGFEHVDGSGPGIEEHLHFLRRRAKPKFTHILDIFNIL